MSNFWETYLPATDFQPLTIIGIKTKCFQVRRILQLPPSCAGQAVEPAVKELQEALTAYLRRATETFDLSKNVEVGRWAVNYPQQHITCFSDSSLMIEFFCVCSISVRQKQLKILRCALVAPIPRHRYVGRTCVNWCGLALQAQPWPKFGIKRPFSDLGLALIDFKL